MELQNTVTGKKNTLEGFNSRLDEAERISNLEDRTVEFILTDQKEKKKKDYLRDLWCNIKRNNILIVGAPEGE